MPVTTLKDFLDKQGVRYVVLRHSEAYTAQEIASLAHIKGKNLAKTVIIKVDGKMAMAVLPASYRLDLKALKKLVGEKSIKLASEEEFKEVFPGCETGAMPPFGNLYDMDVFVSESLAEDETISFNAGSHIELIQLAYKDFERLVKPKVGKFSIKG